MKSNYSFFVAYTEEPSGLALSKPLGPLWDSFFRRHLTMVLVIIVTSLCLANEPQVAQKYWRGSSKFFKPVLRVWLSFACAEIIFVTEDCRLAAADVKRRNYGNLFIHCSWMHRGPYGAAFTVAWNVDVVCFFWLLDIAFGRRLWMPSELELQSRRGLWISEFVVDVP